MPLSSKETSGSFFIPVDNWTRLPQPTKPNIVNRILRRQEPKPFVTDSINTFLSNRTVTLTESLRKNIATNPGINWEQYRKELGGHGLQRVRSQDRRGRKIAVGVDVVPGARQIRLVQQELRSFRHGNLLYHSAMNRSLRSSQGRDDALNAGVLQGG